ncbi:MAG: 50S ribosomal protein L2, large subunit ribosomal protein L2 [candidate division Kazan bacterium GW2011_GWA1_50_15]|uniref:Large ribosomal subunit protein uL2 n=2 Tax=Bacteria division Kazan-3B-28 TaxID=1798534 RepID=A0A0G1ZFQ7_UNCK3|nr:MAG: 50S ribosomal protein L2, large subunit ribosomal protein L2 [candidate division Kazan bacterium GW2011_GWA1_50_15]KKW25400.1 MAG: 50S ribosomal protein L2 [candidate division Kazan bacterium GW2011_GWC1_52_13]KKW26707.1 MAG: 50S ribosomal protein L2 [candidate division Kazan bacterium GW2011_GWB1_52_7]HAV65704.1 50S ribosomal protein L2 [Patescibacteria group bacterium]HCR42924.1 50S ribosomal protein L2 [Patescibacteria group bacterium]
MTVRLLKPVTPGQRGMRVLVYREVLTSKHRPVKGLVRGAKRGSGRNSRGVITSQRRGGGAKQLMRTVDLHQKKFGIPATVRAIAYDPRRTAFIAHVIFSDGEQAYMLAPEGLKVGDRVITNSTAKIKLGNRMQLAAMPAGVTVHNVELVPGKGGQIVRSAGSSATMMGLDSGYALLKLPSGEVRRIPATAYASIGAVSNGEHMNIKIGKAGRHRLMGRRPRVRGKAKNPVDHPHGGGEGGSSIGMKHPKTPTGKPALGYKTRDRKKSSNKLIVKPRPRKKGRKK